MTHASFLRSGHLPTLGASVLYFGYSSSIWVMLGPLVPFLRADLGLSSVQQGLLAATPILAGSLIRPAVGLLADRFGGRRIGVLGLAMTFVPLLLAWLWASTWTHFLGIGVLLGVAGGSFAVALPLAGRWYPRQYQGLAMGVVGVGNAGTLVAALAGPRMAGTLGVASVFALAMLPLAAVMAVFVAFARDSPVSVRTSRADYAAAAREPDTLWFAFFYSLTFGGFIGFAGFLTTFFNEQYAVPPVAAGELAAIAIVGGSLLRPVGGWLSDRVGGYRLLVLLLGACSVCVAVVALTPALWVTVASLAVGISMLGLGNGAVFQLVPQRFPNQVGVVTGLVGTAGGLGGFLLPLALGVVKDATGSYAAGLAGCAVVFAVAMVALLEVGTRWSRAWVPVARHQAGVYSYRTLFSPASDLS